MAFQCRIADHCRDAWPPIQGTRSHCMLLFGAVLFGSSSVLHQPALFRRTSSATVAGRAADHVVGEPSIHRFGGPRRAGTRRRSSFQYALHIQVSRWRLSFVAIGVVSRRRRSAAGGTSPVAFAGTRRRGGVWARVVTGASRRRLLRQLLSDSVAISAPAPASSDF